MPVLFSYLISLSFQSFFASLSLSLSLLSSSFPLFLSLSLTTVWADNADYCATQYTGTGALKTDFTRYEEASSNHSFLTSIACSLSSSLVCLFRTGKRTHLGLLKDGYNSAIRYYYNNFADGFRQVCWSRWGVSILTLYLSLSISFTIDCLFPFLLCRMLSTFFLAIMS